MDRLLTSRDVQKIAGDADVVMYSALAKLRSLHDLKRDLILLYRHNENTGHWVALIKHGPHKIEYFDSYGYPIDGPLDWVPSYRSDSLEERWQGFELGQNRPHLSRLILDFLEEDPRNEVWYNEHKYQGRKHPDSSTCGRYVGYRIRCKKIPLASFQNIFDNKLPSGRGRIGYREDPDEYIIKVTQPHLASPIIKKVRRIYYRPNYRL